MNAIYKFNTKSYIDVNKNYTATNKRIAARAIIRNKNNHFLLIHLKNDNAYEFPGGGVENNETLHQTAIREIIEETGYTIKRINNLIFEQVELHEDRTNLSMLFEATNYYFEAEIQLNNEYRTQHLNEKEVPVWINIDEAISQNRQYIQKFQDKSHPWIIRALEAMEKYKELYLTTASS